MKYLLVNPERMFTLYDLEYKGVMARRSTFLKLIRDSVEYTQVSWYTCLCKDCSTGRASLDQLVALLINETARRLLGYAAQSQEWIDHKAAVRALKSYIVSEYLAVGKCFVKNLAPDQIHRRPGRGPPCRRLYCLNFQR